MIETQIDVRSRLQKLHQFAGELKVMAGEQDSHRLTAAYPDRQITLGSQEVAFEPAR